MYRNYSCEYCYCIHDLLGAYEYFILMNSRTLDNRLSNILYESTVVNLFKYNCVVPRTGNYTYSYSQ